MITKQAAAYLFHLLTTKLQTKMKTMPKEIAILTTKLSS
jgi:hypothetical protein